MNKPLSEFDPASLLSIRLKSEALLSQKTLSTQKGDQSLLYRTPVDEDPLFALFPLEILELIFGYISSASSGLGIAGLVSKRWYTFVNSENSKFFLQYHPTPAEILRKTNDLSLIYGKNTKSLIQYYHLCQTRRIQFDKSLKNVVAPTALTKRKALEQGYPRRGHHEAIRNFFIDSKYLHYITLYDLVNHRRFDLLIYLRQRLAANLDQSVKDTLMYFIVHAIPYDEWPILFDLTSSNENKSEAEQVIQLYDLNKFFDGSLSTECLMKELINLNLLFDPNSPLSKKMQLKNQSGVFHLIKHATIVDPVNDHLNAAFFFHCDETFNDEKSLIILKEAPFNLRKRLYVNHIKHKVLTDFLKDHSLVGFVDKLNQYCSKIYECFNDDYGLSTFKKKLFKTILLILLENNHRYEPHLFKQTVHQIVCQTLSSSVERNRWFQNDLLKKLIKYKPQSLIIHETACSHPLFQSAPENEAKLLTSVIFSDNQNVLLQHETKFGAKTFDQYIEHLSDNRLSRSQTKIICCINHSSLLYDLIPAPQLCSSESFAESYYALCALYPQIDAKLIFQFLLLKQCFRRHRDQLMMISLIEQLNLEEKFVDLFLNDLNDSHKIPWTDRFIPYLDSIRKHPKLWKSPDSTNPNFLFWFDGSKSKSFSKIHKGNVAVILKYLDMFDQSLTPITLIEMTKDWYSFVTIVEFFQMDKFSAIDFFSLTTSEISAILQQIIKFDKLQFLPLLFPHSHSVIQMQSDPKYKVFISLSKDPPPLPEPVPSSSTPKKKRPHCDSSKITKTNTKRQKTVNQRLKNSLTSIMNPFSKD